ncbi:MAG TPA: NAD(P)H-dependent oxidoreductase subunit E [Actinomycetota bacterium]|nr:NAD(P)H-dependent oxidoreductase subunit E [Actinomycetota bacterium]
MTAEAAPAERAAVDALLGPPETSWEGGARTSADLRVSRAPEDRRTLLLPALHALQGAVGWVSEGGLNYVCERLTVPPAEAYGVATFYAMFSLEERAPTVVHVCDDLACRVAGGRELLDACRRDVHPEEAVVVSSPCLGQCERAPAALVQRAGESRDDVVLTDVAASPPRVMQAIRDQRIEGAVAYTSVPREPVYAGDRLLARVGDPSATSLEGYRALGGYTALPRALELGGAEVIQLVTAAKLLGRGGAAFPTGVKWTGVADQRVTPKYVICNADESEPGTFKDRVVMERDPFAVIEALTIAGFATGAEQGYLYIRGEYPLATQRVSKAIEEARDAGLLGAGVFGPGRSFDIELRRGAGAYICGEETALFNSIEGKRGEPRNKPPFPVTHGVFGKPTSINNVETLINVLPILNLGVDEYASVGTADSTGTRLFCLSGHVARPGVYEHPHGVTLSEVIEAAGGVRGGNTIKAILLGGAAGGFVGPDRLDARLTFEDARAGGYTLGSGVVMVLDEDADLVDLCLRIARFFRDESCGQCVPCRVGTVRQEEALHRLVIGRTIGSIADEVALLGDVAAVMRDASICGLGQTAASAVQSAIATFGLFDGEATA